MSTGTLFGPRVVTFSWARCRPSYTPRQMITPGYQGTLGFAFATALGAKVGCPNNPVVAVCGDGGFLFTANELATAARHNIRTVTIVFSDGGYGNVRRMQQDLSTGRLRHKSQRDLAR
jgi:acetolactate synthase I/II/III large subunit